MSIPSYLLEQDYDCGFIPGRLIRRIGRDKDQQGIFEGRDENGSIILNEVIDLIAGAYISSSGILPVKSGDRLYIYKYDFLNSPLAAKARQVLAEWSLLKKHHGLEREILQFATASYSPEQILDLKNRDALKVLFVPIQQKFKIGKFTEVIDWYRVSVDRFKLLMDSLHKGDHMTYIAFIPDIPSQQPAFYSIGTKPHELTNQALRREEFTFKPNLGGHIKCAGIEGDIKTIIVDAGSNYLGRGSKAPYAKAELVVEALYRLYPGYYFIPVEGRGAFGTQQSY